MADQPPRRTLADRRLRLGTLQVYIDPADAWTGVYLAQGDAPDRDDWPVYWCPLPFLVLRWAGGRVAFAAVLIAASVMSAAALPPTVWALLLTVMFGWPAMVVAAHEQRARW